MLPNNPNLQPGQEFYFLKEPGQFFSLQLIQTPSLSISMIESTVQNASEDTTAIQSTTKEMTSMNEAIVFIVQLAHQKTLEGYTLLDSSKRSQYKELTIKKEKTSNLPLELSFTPSEELLSPCNVPNKSLSSQSEYLLIAENSSSRSERKTISDNYELIEENKESSFGITNLEQEDRELAVNKATEQHSKLEFSPDTIQVIGRQKQENCVEEEVSISTFHRVNKEAILKKAEGLDLKCDFSYYIVSLSGPYQRINEFKSYLYQVEVSTKQALYPKYWDLKDTNMYSEIEVAPDCKEFEEITSLMTKSTSRAQITRLVRIQNNYLMDHYITNLNMRQEVSEDENVHRKLLFHGTRLVDPSIIYKSFDTGFDIQYATGRGVFGKGLYFSQSALYSHSFSFPVRNEESKHRLILADVLVGKSHNGIDWDNRIKPPEGYDSVHSGQGFYIIYNNFHSYPLYMIEYTMKKIIKTIAHPKTISAFNFDLFNISDNTNTKLSYPTPPPLQTQSITTADPLQRIQANDFTLQSTLDEKTRRIRALMQSCHSPLMKPDSDNNSASNTELVTPPTDSLRIKRLRQLYERRVNIKRLNPIKWRSTQAAKPVYNNKLSLSALSRVNKETFEIQTDISLDFVCFEEPNETDLSKRILCLTGPRHSPYQGGSFKVQFIFPNDYPFNPPLVSFQTKIYHPCIDSEGNICLGVLYQWSPTVSLKQIALMISALLDNPSIEEPLVPEISHEYINDRQKFESQAQLWTQKYSEQSVDHK